LLIGKKENGIREMREQRVSEDLKSEGIMLTTKDTKITKGEKGRRDL